LPLYGLSIVLGLLTAVADVAAPWGDDTAKVILLLLVAFASLVGFLRPIRPWCWAILIGIWLPLIHLVRHAFGLTDPSHPNTYLSIFILALISLAACLLGAYGGAFVRRVFG